MGGIKKDNFRWWLVGARVQHEYIYKIYNYVINTQQDIVQFLRSTFFSLSVNLFISLHKCCYLFHRQRSRAKGFISGPGCNKSWTHTSTQTEELLRGCRGDMIIKWRKL